MSATYNSGRNTFVGWGLPTDPATLDPTKYEGAVLYNDADQILYYSNGDEWTQPLNAPIRKPYALSPTTSAQQSQLRLSQFLAGTGFEERYRQIAVLFEVYTSPDMTEESRVKLPINYTDPENLWVFPLVFGLSNQGDYQEPNNDYIEYSGDPAVPYRHLRSSYQLPTGIFAPDTTFYWRAKYIANDGQESLYSDLFTQTYPSIIDTPYSIIRSGLITDKIQISEFVSAFGKSYRETRWEIYANPPSGETPVGSPIYSVTTTVDENNNKFNPFKINILSIDSNILVPGNTYYWRGRHIDNDGASSAWSLFTSVIRPETNVVKVIFDTRIGTGSTIEFYLSGSNMIIDWGDGTNSGVGSGTGVYLHTYNIFDRKEYTVTISGSCTSFSFGDGGGQIPSPQQSRNQLVRVKSFGQVNYFAVQNAVNLIEVPDYLPSSITSFQRMFAGCTKFNQHLNNWNTSNVVDMAGMFAGATAFNGDISTWVTSKVGTGGGGSPGSFAGMFSSASSFNQDLKYREFYEFTDPDPIIYWNTARVPSMASMFENARSFNGDVRSWDLSYCDSTASMFKGAIAFNNDLSEWDFSLVSNVSQMFYGAIEFNRDVGKGDFSKVTNFSNMFTNAGNFNRDISHWVLNTTSDVDMSNMFYGARSFNSNIDYNAGNNTWNVSKVTNMSNMFRDCIAFNQPLNNWITTSLTNTYAMFYNARAFDKPISNWNMANVTNASYMFYNAKKFNQDLSWDLSNATDLSWMFAETSSFNGNVRFILCSDPTKTVNLYGMFYGATVFNKPLAYDLNGDGAWNTIRVSNMTYMFYNARSFNQNIGNWDLSNVTTTHAMFYGGISFNQDIGAWDTAKITNMSYMFYNTPQFNNGSSASIQNWNTSAVTNMSGMFWASAFNQPIDTTTDIEQVKHWDVSKVNNFSWMFRSTNFNQPLNNWDTSSGVYFSGVFNYATKFDQPLSNWKMHNAQYVDYMFNGAYVFNQPLTRDGDKWNLSNVVSTYAMFNDTNAFNQNLSSWPITNKVTQMSFMFWNARAFTNGGASLNSWDTSNVVYMYYMFGGSKYNSSLSSWNTVNVQYMHYMFYNSPFNQPINTSGSIWNTANVRSMRAMFMYSQFNQNIGLWTTGNVTDMAYMFYQSPFNQNIGSWTTSNVVYMDHMFYNTNFNQNISGWNIGKVSYMNNMFAGSRGGVATKLSTPNYDALLNIQTGWPSQTTIIPGVVFHAGASKYSSSNGAVTNGRSKLLNSPILWTIIDGGAV